MRKGILVFIVLLALMSGYAMGRHHRPRIFLAEEVVDALLDDHTNPVQTYETSSPFDQLKATYERIEQAATEMNGNPYGQEKWTTNITKAGKKYEVYLFYNTLDENILVTEIDIKGTLAPMKK